jgi:DNA-binding GntR family transcriptional regulator
MAAATENGTAKARPNNLVRQSSGDQAAHYIRTLIFNGDLRPGQRVPQDDIAVALGVSRIPLREALIALEREGWVTIEIHRGAFVNAMDVKTVEDHFELFGLIYGFAMHRAFERSGEEFVAQMETLQAELTATKDPVEAAELIFSMYRTIIDGARSPRVRVVLRAISTLIPGDFFETVPDAIEIERKSLAAVVRALRQGNVDRASDEYTKMLHRVAKVVIREFRQRGLFLRPDEVAKVGA